jgi:hypothetical protein
LAFVATLCVYREEYDGPLLLLYLFVGDSVMVFVAVLGVYREEYDWH